MPDTPRPTPLAPEAAARLAAFARACKAAARVVSLYPPEHPAIEGALDRLASAASAATAQGPLSMMVTPDALLVNGQATARPDPAIGELATLLHNHLVGELTVSPGVDLESWRTFLALLALDTEEIHAQGGIGRAWTTAGGRGLELNEIDYASLVKERDSGDRASWSAIIENCLKVDAVDMDEDTLRVLADIATDVARLGAFVTRLEEQAGTHADAHSRAVALLRVLSGVMEYVERTNPDALETVLQNMASAWSNLSPEVMLELLAVGRTPGTDEAHMVGEITGRITDPMLARFVARSVAAERGCTSRLADVFRALAPTQERQRNVLPLLRGELDASSLSSDREFEHIWNHVEQLLFSYSDSPFVSEAYNQELSQARARAMEIENVPDDPPERIAGWMTTVSDKALRELDLELLCDLLAVQTDPERWRDLTTLVFEHIDDLVLIADFRAATQLLEALKRTANPEHGPERRREVARGLEQLVEGQMMSVVATHLNTLGDPEVAEVHDLCETIGPTLIGRLAETLANEERPRSRQRLTELLISFGEHGRHSVDHLRRSPNPSVRRTAVQLLRSFGGRDALGEIAEMLDDPEANVQREAVRALIGIGSQDAYEVLERALSSETSRARQALMQELGATRDERAVPLFCFIVLNMECRGSLRDVYLRSIARLGTLGGRDAVDALAQVLRKGHSLAPWRWREVWNEAAGALARMKSDEATEALTEAAAQGPFGARRLARRHLKGLA